MTLYRTVIVSVVLYGCETLSLTLRGKRRLRMTKSTAMRKIFGPTEEEVKGEWRKLHNEKLHDLQHVWVRREERRL